MHERTEEAEAREKGEKREEGRSGGKEWGSRKMRSVKGRHGAKETPVETAPSKNRRAYVHSWKRSGRNARTALRRNNVTRYCHARAEIPPPPHVGGHDSEKQFLRALFETHRATSVCALTDESARRERAREKKSRGEN